MAKDLGDLLSYLDERCQERKIVIRKKEMAIHRRGPGGRRDEEMFIKRFMVLALLKKKLCGLCALCG